MRTSGTTTTNQRFARQRQRLEKIAATPPDRATTTQKKRDIATETGGEIVKLGVAHILTPQLAPSEERGGGVTRRPAETGGGGDALAEIDARATTIVRLLAQEMKRPQGEILLAGDRIVVTLSPRSSAGDRVRRSKRSTATKMVAIS